MRKILVILATVLLFVSAGPAVSAQGGVKAGPDPSTLRDPELEKDSLHNLEVARNYFKLRKAYVASLVRCEEIIASNPTFARIDEALWMAGESSLALAENKGKQSPSLYVIHDGTEKKTLTVEQFRELGRQYLTRLITDFPESKYNEKAQASLRGVGGPVKVGQ
jgi:outer membrane protein assembly factor BamD (BamD/ComL family)